MRRTKKIQKYWTQSIQKYTKYSKREILNHKIKKSSIKTIRKN